MQLANAPAKLTVAFAASGSKRTVPVPSQIPITPGAASWTDGFPPLTMTAVNAGGIPPSGLDFNGLGNALSAVLIWLNAGAAFTFDAAFAASIGGYPNGARVLKASGSGFWINTLDNNSSNPDTGGAGWIPNAALSSVYASVQQTLVVGGNKIIYDTVEFDASGLWDAANHRFVAKWAGKYRFNGTTYLPSPGGQDFTADVWVNGAFTKRCFQTPQVTQEDLCLPFNVVLSLSAGDHVEAYTTATQAPVTVGNAAGNQAYVFAQLEYLGT